MNDTTIVCPKCKAGFDISDYANFVKTDFYDAVDEVLKEKKKNDE